VHAPWWSRFASLLLGWGATELLKLPETWCNALGWLAAAIAVLSFARAVGYSVLVLDRASNSFAMFSKGGPTFIRDLDVDLSECSGLRVRTCLALEWIDLIHRGAPRVIWCAARGGVDREQLRELDWFVRTAPPENKRLLIKPRGAGR